MNGQNTLKESAQMPRKFAYNAIIIDTNDKIVFQEGSDDGSWLLQRVREIVSHPHNEGKTKDWRINSITSIFWQFK